MATQNNSAVDWNSSSRNSFNRFETQREETTSPPISSTSHLFSIYDAATLTVGASGILANFSSGLVFIAYRPLRRRLANYFLINQSLIDLLSGLVLILTLIISIDQTTHPPDRAACYFYNAKTIYTSLHVASCFNLVALTFERYAEIVHPIKHKLWITRRKIIASIIFAWMIGFALKFSTNLPTTRVVNGSCVFGVTPTPALGFLVWTCNILMEYLLPIFVISGCYILMARSFRQRVQAIPMSNSQDNSRIRMNIFKTLCLVVVCMALCLLLRQCLFIIFAFNLAEVDFNGTLFNVSLIISYLNSSLNPFIYLFKHQQFKKGFRQIFCRCLKSRSEADSSIQGRSTIATAF